MGKNKRKNAKVSSLIISLILLLGVVPMPAIAAQSCSPNPFFGEVRVDGVATDGATVTLNDLTNGAGPLTTTTSNNGLYLIESANLATCAAVGDQIQLAASFSGASASTIVPYASQSSTRVDLAIATPPVITILGNNPENAEVNTVYVDAGATATDSTDGNLTASIITTSNVTITAPGTYGVIYSVTDSSGNTATATRTVNVIDTTAPAITMNGVSPVSVEVGTAYTDAGATATDNVDAAVTVNATSTVNVNIVGTYIVTYTAADAAGNNAVPVVRNVNVIDTTAPVIIISGNNPETVSQGAAYTDAGATATDNVDGVVTVNSTSTVNVNVVGNYTVTYTAADAAGNNAVPVVRNVNVIDTTAPVITINGVSPVDVVQNTAYTDAGATASDNVDGDITANIVTVNNVDTATVGEYTVTYDISDAAGNPAVQAVRIVNVIPSDTTAPTITINGASQIDVVQNTAYTDAGATASDNVDGDITVNIDTVNNVDTSVIGQYSVTYDVNDAAGNAAVQAVRSVNVVPSDTTAPIIAISGNNPETVSQGAAYTDAGATASDNVDGNITANIITINNVNTAAVGTYNVTYDVNDAAGNAAVQAVRTVNVVDTTAPVITMNGASPVDVVVGTSYTDAGATATDNVDATVTVNAASNVNVNVVGTYTVTYTAADAAGNNAVQVVRTVKVVDTIVPVITINGASQIDVVQNTAYTDAGATASDNVDGDISANIAVVNNVNTATVGAYTVTYDVSDAAGNPAVQKVRAVNVIADAIPPAITILGNNPEAVILNEIYADAGATALDNIDGDITASIAAISSVNTAIEGTYEINYSVTDAAGNPAIETRTVVVLPKLNAVSPQANLKNKFPLWYEDDNNIKLELCLKQNGLCVLPPAFDPSKTNPVTPIGAVGAGTFPDESYYWAATAEAAVGSQGDTAILTLALTAGFDNKVVADGNQKTSLDVSLKQITGLEPNSVYKVTYPFGYFTVATDETGTTIPVISNVAYKALDGCSITPGNPCVFSDLLSARNTQIGAFLQWDPLVAPLAPAGYIGDPAVSHAVTGSPIGQSFNKFAIEGPNINPQNIGGTGVNRIEQPLFSLSGKIFAQDLELPVITIIGNNPAAVIQGHAYVDEGATAFDNFDGDITEFIQKTGTVDTNTVGSYAIDYTVADSFGNSVTERRNANVAANTPPNVVTIPLQTVNIDNAVSFPVIADDIEGDVLTYSLSANSPIGTTINPATGAFSWTPLIAGTYNFDVLVSDGFNQAVAEPVTINVNTLPVITLIPMQSVMMGNTLALNVLAEDADGNALTYSLSGNAPNGLAIDSAGAISWTPTVKGGMYNFDVQVSDGIATVASPAAVKVLFTPATSEDYSGKDGVWQKDNQTITLTPDCGLWACEWTRYCLGNECEPSAGTDYIAPVAISTEGTTYFKFTSKGNDGTIKPVETITVNIDRKSSSRNDVVLNSENATHIRNDDDDIELEINTTSNQTVALSMRKLDRAENISSVGIPALGKYVEITAPAVESIMADSVIKLYYTDAEISAAGLSESTLRLYYHNITSGEWVKYEGNDGVAPDGGVDTTNNFVWAKTDHFSTWGVFGNSAPAPEQASGGGDGGSSSGGGGSSRRWDCNEWSSCANGKQTRTCTLGNAKSTETQACKVTAKETPKEIPKETPKIGQEAAAIEPDTSGRAVELRSGAQNPESSDGISSITGQAIQNLFGKGSPIALAIIVFAILGIGFGGYLRYRKK